MIRFPEGGAKPGSLLRLSAKAALFAVAAAAFSHAACPVDRDVRFLQGLNADGQFHLAAFQAEILRRSPDCPVRPEIDLELGKAHYQMGDFRRTREILGPHTGAADARFRRYYLESYLLDFAHPEGLDAALAQLQGASPALVLPEPERKRFLAAVHFTAGREAEARAAWPSDPGEPMCADPGDPGCYLRAGFRSLGLAAGLSAVPGLGYVYAGQPGDGVFAFTLVSLFYGVAAYYAWQDAPARAWTLGGFGAVFHVSNMYGAHRSARAANKRAKIAFLASLHDRLFR